MSISQLFHTVKYLKPGQVTNRLVRRLHKPRPYSGEALRPIAPQFSWQAYGALKPCFVGDGLAMFLNETGPLLEWENPDKSKLWLYNLHYFDDLVAEGMSDRHPLHREVIDCWLRDNPPLTGTGWEPYPLSLRICNWVKWLLMENDAVEGMQVSLLAQADALSQQVEHHLLGNHILANAKALVFAGTYFKTESFNEESFNEESFKTESFEGEVAEQWLNAGLALLEEQLPEQVLQDGAHFELSPMYHCIILTDVLDMLQLGRLYPNSKIARHATELKNTAAVMVRWLEGMLHPDGDIPFFNDAAFGITASPAAILDYSDQMDVVRGELVGGMQHHEASGYVAVNIAEQFALLDVASIGPDYIPGHAHADTLSFEWSLKGQRVFVNSGTSVYGINEERLRQRQTAAHNTVVVNGEDSSEVWSGFRVARRARSFGVEATQTGKSVVVKACHDGYCRLNPKVIHRREWSLAPGALEIKDTLNGRFKTAVAYLHLHPLVTARLNEDGGEGANKGVELLLADGTRCELAVKGGEISLEGSTWHPEFGRCQASKRLAVYFSSPQLTISVRY